MRQHKRSFCDSPREQALPPCHSRTCTLCPSVCSKAHTFSPPCWTWDCKCFPSLSRGQIQSSSLLYAASIIQHQLKNIHWMNSRRNKRQISRNWSGAHTSAVSFLNSLSSIRKPRFADKAPAHQIPASCPVIPPPRLNLDTPVCWSLHQHFKLSPNAPCSFISPCLHTCCWLFLKTHLPTPADN